MSTHTDSPQLGELLPERVHTPTRVSLFLYNAALWNAHRIHYDEAYAREVEGYAGLVVDGPLQGDWLAQCCTNWLGERGVLERFQYRNRRLVYLGETLRSGGRVGAVTADGHVTLELWVRGCDGEITTHGAATVRLYAPATTNS